MPEYKTEPFIVPSISGLLPVGERNPRVALTSFDPREKKVQVPSREVTCYECGRRSHVPSAALSANCIHCHAHLNMTDIELKPGSRRLTVRTLGNVTIAPDAVLSHLSVVCHHLDMGGRASGSFRCSGTLTISGGTRIEGSVQAASLVVNKGISVILTQGAALQDATIYGRVSGRIEASGCVRICRGGELCGDCCAAEIQVEQGGAHLGNWIRP
ncbi:MAG: polymer-forming cytoskeletal protein [Akkermansia sp.]|nr:polymer-forming cytoskeletal protein [Akkermansia sp.]